MSKFLSMFFLLTCICLLYIYQQTEVFRLAYLGQKKQAVFDDLLDKNSILRYNICRSSSLTDIENKIAKTAGFEMPGSFRLVRLAPSPGGSKLVGQPNNRETFIARIFSIKRQAEAKTINP
jgi:hypothetical protein